MALVAYGGDRLSHRRRAGALQVGEGRTGGGRGRGIRASIAAHRWGWAMKYLVMLIIMALSAGAGWWGGSWKGRDAIQALAKAQDMAQQATTERDRVQADLNKTLAKLTADYQQAQARRDAEHAQARDDLARQLAGRDKTIAEIGRARDSRQAEIGRLRLQADAAGTSAEDRSRLLAEVERLKRDVADKDTQIAGFECSKVPVPAPLLAPLQGI